MEQCTVSIMRTLYMVTSGSADPTRASVPLHLAVNGSLEIGHTVGVVLAGDATELLKVDVRQGLEGLGVPPMRDLLAKARQHEVPVYV
jgi:predicted peroxiredoxin